MKEVHPSTPVLVGVGRYTFHRKGRPEELRRYGLSPLQMSLEATQRAFRDAGQDTTTELRLDSIACVGCATDAQVALAVGREAGDDLKAALSGGQRLLHTNPPGALAAALGCDPGSMRELVLTGDSGSMPQALVNRAFEKIARGELQSALVVGSEALHSLRAAQAAGVKARELQSRWGPAELEPKAQGRFEQLQSALGLSIFPPGKSLDEANFFYTELWRKHGLGAPMAAYPLLENSLRVELGRSLEEQRTAVAELFSGLSEVAAAAPEHSWFGAAYSPEELSTESSENRRICHPFYLKRLNSVMDVDMASALLIMSAGEAQRRKVPREKWIFLHGCSEADDRIEVLERPSVCSSPAIHFAGARALRMAGVKDVNTDIRFFDLYSCFPVAVQVACRELGIHGKDGRQLTLTGGLPYHGGPGSNYVAHSIATAAEQLRGCADNARALVTANGGYLTKHAFGVYANFPDGAATRGEWEREDPAICQQEVNALPPVRVAKEPAGRAMVESYCVRYGRQGPQLGVVIGKLLDGPMAGCRFIANTAADDKATLMAFVDGDPIGVVGRVECVRGKGVFRLSDRRSRL